MRRAETDRDVAVVPPVRRADAVWARFTEPPSRQTIALVSAMPIALATALVAWLSIRAIYAKVGHPGAALDDSFIHFQYARAIAEGHPFRFQAGEPMTMGATSALWPLLLAPFYWLGFKGDLILWPAWALSFVALGFLVREMLLVTRPLAGREAAVGAATMAALFGPFTWCAGSGMEVVPFAFCLVRAVRRASEWVEGDRTGARQRELLALAFVAPLLRPEGAIASLLIALALAVRSHGKGARRLAFGLALVGAVTPQLLSVLVTGALRSNTAQVKLLPGNPYYVGSALLGILGDNLGTLVHTLLEGEVWAAEFIPHGSMPVAFAGLACILVRTRRRSLWFRGAAILLMAASIAIPCAYVSFLWNRLRYLWPFAPFWLIGLACLARVVGDALCRVRPRWRVATPIIAAFMAGMLATKEEGVIDDLSTSVSAIDRQQVALGRWAKDHIPEGARIGVNDTGAVAYFGEHPTFDVVGLTTPDEARYWVAGAASRYEHYERLLVTSPERLPAYFIVYPEWMACDAVLGPALFSSTVTDSTILGGTTMTVYAADYSRLGSGERPWSHADTIVDSLDVADLESETQHAYDLLGTGDGDEIISTRATPNDSDAVVTDGGRRERRRERFRVRLGGREHSLRGIVRLEASETTRVEVLVDGHDSGSFEVDSGSWTEESFALPPATDGATIELVPDSGVLTTYHYWFVSP